MSAQRLHLPRLSASLRLLRLASGGWLTLLLSGCFFFGTSPPPLPKLPDNAMRKAAWSFRIGSADVPLALSPVFIDGFVYAASSRGQVMRIDAANGKQDWRTDLKSPITGAVGATDNMLAVGTADGQVVALGLDGKERWRVRLTSEITAPPLVRDDMVVARTADQRVFALEANNGQRRWLFQRTPPALVVRGFNAFAAEGPLIYTGLPGGKLTALLSLNGGPRWESTVSIPKGTTEIERMSDVVGMPWTSAREVCAASYQGRVACFDNANGNTLWTKDIASSTGISGDARYLFVSDDKGAIIALDRSDGNVVWRQEQLVGRSLSAPTAVGNEVVIGDMTGVVHFLDRESGRLIGRGTTNGTPIDVPPVAIPNGVVVQTRGGALMAFPAE